jgi:CheY-like chemotaxis protein
MKSGTVLIVDDEKQQRDVIRNILEPHYRILEAEDCEDAIAMHRQNIGHIDLLLVDIILPSGTGFDLCDGILELEPHVKVLYLSGATGAELRKFVPDRPGARFVSKPFHPQHLLDEVNSLFGEVPSR